LQQTTREQQQKHTTSKPTEFLTHQTTCASVMSKRTTSENFFGKKDHLAVAIRLARRHVERAAWANDSKAVPPSPKPARLLSSTAVRGGGPCRLGRCRQAEVAHAATLKTGTLGTGRQRIPTLNGADSHADWGVFFGGNGRICVYL
jgi:hypothetical protein